MYLYTFSSGQQSSQATKNCLLELQWQYDKESVLLVFFIVEVHESECDPAKPRLELNIIKLFKKMI